MVHDPYVNHIPVLTGGYGHEALRRFYQEDFISPMPADTSIQLVARTLGQDRLVDEIILSFTHKAEMPWMLPGVPPPAAAWRSHLSWSSDFATASSHTSASTGTRRLCSNKSGCSRIQRFPYLGPRPHANSWIPRFPELNMAPDEE